MSDIGSLKAGNIFYLEEESVVTGAMARRYYKFIALEGNQIKVEPSSVISEAFFTDLELKMLSLEEMSNFLIDQEDDHEI